MAQWRDKESAGNPLSMQAEFASPEDKLDCEASDIQSFYANLDNLAAFNPLALNSQNNTPMNALDEAQQQKALTWSEKKYQSGTATFKSGSIQLAELQAFVGAKITGTVDKQTIEAVARFQMLHGLQIDGMAGPQTIQACRELSSTLVSDTNLDTKTEENTPLEPSAKPIINDSAPPTPSPDAVDVAPQDTDDEYDITNVESVPADKKEVDEQVVVDKIESATQDFNKDADVTTNSDNKSSDVSKSAYIPPVRSNDYWVYGGASNSSARVASAMSRVDDMKAVFAEAGVSWPPAEIYFRVFKAEGEMEVWANSKTGEPMKPVMTYKVEAMSGDVGPKRKQGDHQVPEGFYKFDALNNASSYHLSMHVNYPNASDKIKGVQGNLGGDIMAHGKSVSDGCVALGDKNIEEIWSIIQSMSKHDNKNLPPITIFPTRDLDQVLGDWQAYDGQYHAHYELWRQLKAGKHQFEETGRPPEVKVDAKGNYILDNN